MIHLPGIVTAVAMRLGPRKRGITGVERSDRSRRFVGARVATWPVPTDIMSRTVVDVDCCIIRHPVLLSNTDLGFSMYLILSKEDH